MLSPILVRAGTVFAMLILAACASDAPMPKAGRPATRAPEVRAPLPTDGSLTTDNSVYTASCQGESYEKRCTFTLVMTYTNQTDDAIYFDHCYPDDTYPIYFVRGLTHEESAYGGVWACTGHDRSVSVLPGEKRVDTLEILGPNAWDGRTGEPFGALEGRLQLLYAAYTCADELAECSLPDEVATSNVFEVQVED